jgi:hypothetical protein
VTEVALVNREMLLRNTEFTVLRSIEMNLNPIGVGDMNHHRCVGWTLPFVPFTRRFVATKTRLRVISPHFATLTFTSSVSRVAGSIITAWV